MVEQGVKDGWTYEKWNNGIAKCYCRTTTNSGADPAGIYSKQLTLPFTFADSNYFVFLTNRQADSFGDFAFQYYQVGNESFWIGTKTASKIVMVEVVGRWK